MNETSSDWDVLETLPNRRSGNTSSDALPAPTPDQASPLLLKRQLHRAHTSFSFSALAATASSIFFFFDETRSSFFAWQTSCSHEEQLREKWSGFECPARAVDA